MFPYVFRIRSTILTVFQNFLKEVEYRWKNDLYCCRFLWFHLLPLLTLTKLLRQQLSFSCFRIYTVCISHSPSLSKIWKLESSRGQDLDFSHIHFFSSHSQSPALAQLRTLGIQKWHGFQIHISNLDLFSSHLTYLKICLALNNTF